MMFRRRIAWVAVIAVLVAVAIFSYKRDQTTAQVSAHAEEGEILYWTCGMHPSVKSDKPGKCPICNMDLVPVHKGEGEAEEEGEVTLRLSPRAQKLAGVRTFEVTYLPLAKEVRTVGRIDYDEREQACVASRIPGRIDRLYVDFTGTEVKKGAPLVWIYSPALVSTQEEYLLALETLKKVEGSHIKDVVEGAESLVESTKKRLLLWGITEGQIDELEKRGRGETHMTIHAPISGTVIQKTALEGKYVKEGENIYHIADLTNVWMLADIYEEDISWITLGQEVEITSLTYPEEVFRGKTSFVQPYLDERTRTVKIRVDVPNPGGKLKPGMWVDATVKVPVSSVSPIASGASEHYYTCPTHPEVIAEEPGQCLECGMYLKRIEGGLVLSVPKSAVLDVGMRKLVYVEKGKGMYEPREIRVGPEAEAQADGRKEKFFPICEGLAEGERVVTRANFLIDSQTQLTGEAAGAYGGALEVEE